MIDKFKKSHLGQLLITAFLVASVVAGVVIWFYESIRIPTLVEQIAFREDKINSLEVAVSKAKEQNRGLESAIENEKLESTKWMASAKQSADELSQVSEKLQGAQEQQIRTAQELTRARMDSLRE